LSGHESSLARYKQVRALKTLSLTGGMMFGLYEISLLKQKWKYIDRLYPEPTQLQKTLEKEALQYKENKYTVSSIAEKMLKLEDPNIQRKYSQFYQLAPQRNIDEENEFNPPEHKEHY
jgi:hypothetical protein